jgi:hypothetical protein
MRPPAFWEEKKRAAEAAKEHCEAGLRRANKGMQKFRRFLSHGHVVDFKRQSFRTQLAKSTSKAATLRAKIRQLDTTKIPYYQKMLDREPPTLWERLK